MIDLLNNKLALVCPDPVIGVDLSGYINVFNPAAENLLGYHQEEVIGKKHISDIYHPGKSAYDIMRLILSTKHGKEGQLKAHETKVKSKNGSIIPIQISATLLEENGKKIGSVGFFHDLTEQKQLEQSLKELAITDGLTGLYNQRHFHSVLSAELERCKRYGRSISMVCIDMDNFKTVNDTLGHLEGDNILRLVGELIKDVLRQSDFGFRYGGDEFMLILPETDQKEATKLAKRLAQHFNEKKPASLLEHDELALPVSLSMGIAELSADEAVGLFIKRADLAMYQAKKQPGNSTVSADEWAELNPDA